MSNEPQPGQNLDPSINPLAQEALSARWAWGIFMVPLVGGWWGIFGLDRKELKGIWRQGELPEGLLLEWAQEEQRAWAESIEPGPIVAGPSIEELGL